MESWQTAKVVDSKSDTLQNLQFKIWRVFEKLIQSQTRCTNFKSKSDTLENVWLKTWHAVRFSMKMLISEKARKMRKLLFLRNKTCRNLIFWKIYFQIWNVVKFWIQNPTRCENLYSNADAMWKSWFNIWGVVKFSIENLTCWKIFSPNSVFQLIFQVLTERSYLQSSNVSAFQSNNFQSVRFRLKICTTCLTLNQIFKRPSDFELKVLQRVRV